MKTIAGLLCIAATILSSAQVNAQQVATIGLGDITYSAGADKQLRSVENILSAIDSKIVDSLTKTRKFDVMDNSKLKKRLAKQGRNLEGYYEKQYTGNAVWQEGLDFILRAKITEYGLFNQNNAEKTGAKVKIDFELFGVADVTYDFKSSVNGVYPIIVSAGNKGVINSLDLAIGKSTNRMVEQIISSLFPIKIVKIEEDEDLPNYGDITLNYGEGLLEIGDVVAVYSSDAELIINELGQAVGNAVTTIRVTETSQKFSIARALEVNNSAKNKDQEGLIKGQIGRLLLSKRS